MPFGAVAGAVATAAGASSIAAAAIGAVGSMVGTVIKGAVMGGSGGGGGGGGGSSGGYGGGSGMSPSMLQYVNRGPAPGQAPSIGGSEKANSVPLMPLDNKISQGRAATESNLRSTPSQAVGEVQAKADSQNVWADKLSKYLDYNTRSLG